MTDKRILFLGTPDISAFVLEGLVKVGFNIVGVVTKEDKIRGRNNEIEASPVAKKAVELNIPVFKPHRLNKEHGFIEKLKPDLLLTFAYGQILSDEVLALGTYKPLNLHASLLPKYRGAAPIQYALRNGDNETGVTLMEMAHDLDAGDIYAVKSLPILEEDNYTSLADRLAQCALDLAIESLPLFFEDKLNPIPQDGSLATFCPTIKKEEEKLNLYTDPTTFINQVRSLSYTPGGYLYKENEMLKIYKASYYSDKTDLEVGKLLRPSKKELVLQLEKGQVKILELQRPGKKRMSAIDFLNGVNNIDKIQLK